MAFNPINLIFGYLAGLPQFMVLIFCFYRRQMRHIKIRPDSRRVTDKRRIQDKTAQSGVRTRQVVTVRLERLTPLRHKRVELVILVALEVLWHLEHMRQLALRLVFAVGLAGVLCSGFRNLRLMLGHQQSLVGLSGVDTA